MSFHIFSTFSLGQSTLTFDCVKETDLILIHSNKLNYTKLDYAHLARLSDSGTVCMHTSAHT